ncbi:MAG: CamS family sex pheromone protein, partial [Coprobacillaceae bacterium]
MKKLLILGLLSLVIAGCSQAKEQVESQTNADSTVSDSLGDTYYSIIKRETNEDRNDFYMSLSSTKDFQIVGRELEKLSIPHFSTDSYYMAEGQYLDSSDRTQLLTRTNLAVSATEYPHSIQPQRDTTIDGLLNPIMVSNIYEQDFYSDEAGEELAGVSFAIVIDPLTEDRQALTTPMKDEEIKKFSESIIPKFYEYLRNEKKEFKEIPINICVYQAANKINSSIDGRYILSCYSESSLGSIETLNYQNVIFSSTDAETLDGATSTEFAQLKAEMKKLSVDAVGVVGKGYYQDNVIQSMTIDVTVNVKTYGELEFFVSKSLELVDNA